MNLEKILYESQLGDDPTQSLINWQQKAQALGDAYNACALATADLKGRPSVRIVLAKEVTPEGLIFYTNYDSNKSLDLKENPQAEMNFYFHLLEKQVRVFGSIEKTSRSKSQDYFESRDKSSQIASSISKQSEVLPSLKLLESTFEKSVEEYSSKDLPCPENWGGYILKPKSFEFFIYGQHRLNIRKLYKLNNKKWESSFLWP